jgi:hypothetical protein
VRGARGARRRVAGAVVPMHLLGPGAIRPDKSWVFFTKETKKRERERRSIQVRTCGSVEISSSSQSNVSGGRGTRRTQAAPLEETRPGREGGCGLRGFAAGGEKAPQLYAFVKRDTREKAPNKEALGPLNYTAFLFCP